jgi:hypothetical protein
VGGKGADTGKVREGQERIHVRGEGKERIQVMGGGAGADTGNGGRGRSGYR